jgi:hypothetical protein
LLYSLTLKASSEPKTFFGKSYIAPGLVLFRLQPQVGTLLVHDLHLAAGLVRLLLDHSAILEGYASGRAFETRRRSLPGFIVT